MEEVVSIDTAKLREQAGQFYESADTIMQLCDELDLARDELKQTRAVVLKLRDVVEATSNVEPSKLSAWRDTESYEQYR